ncbi:MAG: glycosyltransferase family 4 protein [Pseudomonadota bacterium]
MRIYTITERYPSPYKSYFDTQFEQFLADGHSLRIYAADKQGGTLEEKVRRLGLDRMTQYFPSTQKALPKCMGRMAVNFLKNPIWRLRAAGRVWSRRIGAKDGIMNIARMLILPEESPDLCLVHNLSVAAKFTFLKAVYPGAPVSFYYHGGEVAGVPQVSPNAARRAFDSVDVIFTNTSNSREHAIARGAAADRVVVCPVGFNISEFTPPEERRYRQNGMLNLLSIGRVSEEKGFIYALEAVKLLGQRGLKDVHYRLIGDGPLLGQLKAFVAENDLSAQVEFMGQVSRDAVYSALSEADVLILPSIVLGTWQENQACVVQEAMLYKTLVVATTTGGVPESLAPELSRFSVRPADPKDIAEKIIDVCALSENEMRTIGDAARQFVVEGYDIKALNKTIIDRSIEALEYR